MLLKDPFSMTNIKICLPLNNELLKVTLDFFPINAMALFSVYIMHSSSQCLVKLLILPLASRLFVWANIQHKVWLPWNIKQVFSFLNFVISISWSYPIENKCKLWAQFTKIIGSIYTGFLWRWLRKSVEGTASTSKWNVCSYSFINILLLF